jgi:aspartyl-tRNA synthetase
MTFIDLRDRYGITQLVFDMETDAASLQGSPKNSDVNMLFRLKGKVRERSNKNPRMATGDIEIEVKN